MTSRVRWRRGTAQPGTAERADHVRAHDADGERKPRQILERHRNEKESQKRRAFKKRDEPELAKCGHDADDTQMELGPERISPVDNSAALVAMRADLQSMIAENHRAG